MPTRRQALKHLLTVAGGTLTAACVARTGGAAGDDALERKARAVNAPAAPMPVIFLAHGAPPLLEDPLWMSELAAWGQALPRPKAILSLSAHWDARPLRIGAVQPVPLIYDFSGFPDHFYRLQYRSPGAPAVAARVRDLLREAGLAFTEDPARGLDHGTWVPLMPMYPQADVPVLQISLPGLDPKALFALGQALAPLRDEGVLIMGSGFLTHNMRAFSRETPIWAAEFDHWCAETLLRHDVDALLDYQARAPAVRIALPTVEHFVPVIVSAGAADARASKQAVNFPVTGFAFGSFTKRSVQYG